MTKPKSARAAKEVSDESIAVVRRAVRELETRQAAGTLTKDSYKSIADAAKKTVGKDWPDVAEAIENLKP